MNKASFHCHVSCCVLCFDIDESFDRVFLPIRHSLCSYSLYLCNNSFIGHPFLFRLLVHTVSNMLCDHLFETSWKNDISSMCHMASVNWSKRCHFIVFIRDVWHAPKIDFQAVQGWQSFFLSTLSRHLCKKEMYFLVGSILKGQYNW